MSEHRFCRLALKGTKAAAWAALPEVVGGLYVDPPSKMCSGKKWYWVRRADGTVLWQGATCCAWSAMDQALEKLLADEEAARVDAYQGELVECADCDTATVPSAAGFGVCLPCQAAGLLDPPDMGVGYDGAAENEYLRWRREGGL
jgi:hypothetical protein